MMKIYMIAFFSSNFIEMDWDLDYLVNYQILGEILLDPCKNRSHQCLLEVVLGGTKMGSTSMAHILLSILRSGFHGNSNLQYSIKCQFV